MPRVLNKKNDGVPPGSIYVGRPTEWGNPFKIGRDGDREEVIRKYRAYISISTYLKEKARKELRGKDLVCWCAPESCHADVLLDVANREME